jgi:O-antigen ligase
MLSEILMTIKGLLVIGLAVYGFAALLRKEDAEWVKRAPLAIFLSILFIGMWGQTVWVVYAALLLIIPLLAKSRSDAAALYAVALVSCPSIKDKVAIGSVYLLPLSKFVFLSLGLWIAFLVKRRGAPTPGRSHFDIPILIIAFLELAQARSDSPTVVLRQTVITVLVVLLPYFAVSRSLTNATEVRRFTLAIALAGFVMAAVATVEGRLHWLIYKHIEATLHISSVMNPYLKLRAGVIRSPASFQESTSLGIYLALATVMLFAVRPNFASAGKWLLALAVMGLGLLSANSRGAFVALAIGVIAFDFYRRRYPDLLAKIAVGAGLFLMVLAAAQFSEFFASVLGRGSGEAGSADYRFLLWHRGLEEIAKHPLFGTSLQTAMNHLEDLRQGEDIIDIVNGYINYGLTAGYPGMVGLLLVFVSLCGAMLLMRRTTGVRLPISDSAGAVFAIAGYSIVSCFYGGFGGEASSPFYSVAALGSALWAMRRYAAAEEHGTAVNALKRVPPVQALIAADRAEAPSRNRRLRGLGLAEAPLQSTSDATA